MTTRYNETPPRDGESVPEGQKSAPVRSGDDTTSLTTLQHRIGPIRLKVRLPGALIALRVMAPCGAALLTQDEARQLIGALADLLGDLDRDRLAYAWSARLLDATDATADGSQGRL